MIWGGLRDLGSNEPNWCKPNQSTYRQHLPKVCVQQFHGQDEDWFGIFLGSCGSFWVGDYAPRRNLSNLNFWVSEVKKVNFGSVEKMGCECRNVSVTQKVQIFGERSILKKWSILYGGLRGSIWFLKNSIWFLGGAKVLVKKSFFIENLKMDTGQFFWLICGYCYEPMCKSSIYSIWVCAKWVPKLCILSEKSKNFEKKSNPNQSKPNQSWAKSEQPKSEQAKSELSLIRASQIRVSQIRVSQIRATLISSNHRELHGAIFGPSSPVHWFAEHRHLMVKASFLVVDANASCSCAS